MTLRWCLRLVVLSVLILLSACGKEPLYQEQGYVFGTLVEVSVYGEDEAKARQAVVAVMQEFQRLHNMLHAWQPSELTQLNEAFAAGLVKEVTPEMAKILADAEYLSAKSNGLFNPAIGKLIELWGFQADDFKAQLPDPNRIAELVNAKPEMVNVQISWSKDTGKYHAKAGRSVKIDLGGYAKGYALDRAAEILKKMGVHNALINIGGNVLAIGQHGDRPWRVGIQHPRKPGPIATLELHDGEAIGTSGDYQRYFELNGKRYCHLIDPRTGQPVQGVQAVTILTHGDHAGVLSDADSKPLFISGVQGWRAAAQRMELEEALLIDGSGKVHLTAAMQKRLELADKATASEVEP